MKKRILSFVLVLVIAIGFLPTIAFAETYGDLGYRVFDDGRVIITSSNSNVTTIEIPAEINGYPVTIIADDAFRGCKNLTDISIPNSVTDIFSGAFYGCTSLYNITIPDSVTHISADAFYNTAYYNDSNNWENDVLYIDNCLISAKETLSGTYRTKNGTVAIAYGAFDECKNLEKLIINEGVKYFANDILIKTIHLPSTIKGIGSLNSEKIVYNGVASQFIKVEYAIEGTYSYEKIEGKYQASFNIEFSDGSQGCSIYSFGGRLNTSPLFLVVYKQETLEFYGDSSIIFATYNRDTGYYDKITLPEKTIQNTKNITINSGIKYIDENSFENFTNLESISIPLTVTEIKSYAFNNCTNLKKVFFEGTEEQWNDIVIYPFNVSLKNAAVYFNTSSHEHIFTNYVYNNDATTYADGTKTRKCSVCGHSETVVATGTKLPTPVEKPIVNTSAVFYDVVASEWYKQYVDYAYTYNIFKGNEDGTFKPLANITRAEFVQVLANITNINTSNKAVVTKFLDVKAGDWFAPAVKWANDNGIVAGYGAEFKPQNNITREQMCVMIVNYAKYRGIALSVVEARETFADDYAISSWAKDAVYACQMADIVNGKGGGRFDPAGTGLRAEASVIFTKFHQSYLR